MSVIPNTRGNPQASEIAVQTALPMVGSASREDLQSTLGLADAELAKLFEDRNVLLADGGLVTYLGTTVTFTQPLKLHINSKIAGGSPVIVDLAATTRTISADGRMIYAVVNRTAGTATVTDDAATLPAVTSADQEVFLIAKRIDSGDGTLRLYFRNGSAFDQGQTARLGSSGSGSGNASEDLETLKNTLVASTYELLTPVVFPTDEDDFVDGASTGAYNLVSKRFTMDATGETYVSTQLLDQDGFLVDGKDLLEAEVVLVYDKTHIDDSPTVELSRNNGGNYQAVTMERIQGTDTWRGRLAFADTETQASQFTYAVGNADDTEQLNISTKQRLSQAFTVSNTTVLKSVDLYLNKTGSPLGYFYASIVRANGSNPSTLTEDIMGESQAQDISALSSGNITATVNLPSIVLPAGTYHIVLRTDAAYAASFVNTTTELRWRSDASSPALVGRQYDGSAWTANAEQFTYDLKGRVLNLRVRVTASNPAGDNADNEFRLRAVGVFYAPQEGLLLGDKLVDRVSFQSNTQNLASFTLNFNPDPDLLNVYHVQTGQVYKYPAFSISERVVSFPANTFQQDVDNLVSLIFLQAVGSVDNSDANAGAIANIRDSLSSNQVLPTYLTPINGTPGATQFRSEITNHAPMLDLANDLLPRMGVSRIITQRAEPATGEFSTVGLVYKPVNDRFNQVRFVGNITFPNPDAAGVYCALNSINDFVEIKFYGNGLNLLALKSGSAADIRATVDGGAEGGSSLILSTGSAVLNGREYSTYQIFPVAAGLSEGLHTVKLRLATAVQCQVYGFEVINNVSTMKVNPGSAIVGGRKTVLSSVSSTAYNSGFESGTLGTRGGKAVIYLKNDGTIGKAVNPANPSSATFSSADHSNEEVTGSHFWRQFGAGRSDDFSLRLGGGASVFSLDDNATSLYSNGGAETTEAIVLPTSGYIAVDFVGSGLDIERHDLISSGTVGDTVEVFVDGVSIGNLTTNGVSPSFRGMMKIVSGLPYGSHRVKFLMTANAAGDDVGFKRFIVYGPKKPTVPSTAKELGTYNIMANYVANATAGIDRIATGVLRKTYMREFNYIGSWSVDSLDLVSNIIGANTFTSTSGNNLRLPFWGQGWEYRARANTAYSSNILVELSTDGGATFSTLNTTNFPSLVSAVYGGMSFNTGTGVLSIAVSNTVGSGWSLSGLPLNNYVLRMTTNAAATFTMHALDIITPIHNHRLNGGITLQNTVLVGNQGVEDTRRFSGTLAKADSTQFTKHLLRTTRSATAATYQPTECAVSFYLDEDSMVDFDLSGILVAASASTRPTIAIHLNGVRIGPETVYESINTSGHWVTCTGTHSTRLPKGWYTAIVMIRTNGGSILGATQDGSYISVNRRAV